MKSKKIKAIIRAKLGDITLQAAEIANSFDKDVIHDFRVGVKSLRSFLRLQRMYTHKPGMKLTKKFKHLYNISGALREAQLEMEHISKKEEIASYVNELENLIALKKEEWRKHYSRKILHKLDKKLSGFKYKPLHPEMLGKFFSDRMTALDTITNETAPSDTRVHAARKRIKDILYNSKIAEQKWKAAQKQVEDIPAKQLTNLANMIGDYNDDRIRLAHLNAFATGDMQKNEQSAMKHLRGKESKKLKAKKKNILISAREFTGTSAG